jgi:phage shock protein C
MNLVVFTIGLIIFAKKNLEEMKRIQSLLEFSVFGVCTNIGNRFGIASSSIRKYFVYLSFFTFGSPIIIYLALAFWFDIWKHFRKNRSAVWDF